MANLSTYEEQQRAKALQEQSAYEQSRNKQASDYYNQISQSIDTLTNAQKSGLQKQADSVPAQYRPQFDTNAVDALVRQRMGAENSANLGLANSGYHRLQQTAAQARKQTADANTRAAQQSDIDAIQQQITQLLAEAASKKQAQSADIYSAASSDILNNKNSLLAAAMQSASNLYGTDVNATQQAAALAQQKLLADRERQQQLLLQEEAKKNNTYIAMLQAGYSPSVAKNVAYGDGSLYYALPASTSNSTTSNSSANSSTSTNKVGTSNSKSSGSSISGQSSTASSKIK